MCMCRFVLTLVIVYSVNASQKKYIPENTREAIINKVFKECLDSKARMSCFSEKAAIAIERSMNWDIPIFDGLKLIRNDEKINFRAGKSLSGLKRLKNAVSNFIDTHVLTLDLTNSERDIKSRSDEARGGGEGGGGGGIGGGGGGGGGGGLFDMSKKQMKKEKKYYQYAFMVLLGIFGLTGPLVMKVLGVMAAKALLAAKAALIIVGSVALKKLFEKDHSQPKVKVHTIPSYESEEHDYDRIGHSYNHIPYGYSTFTSSGGHHPYSSYYSNDDFAPVLYGTPYNANKASKTR